MARTRTHLGRSHLFLWPLVAVLAGCAGQTAVEPPVPASPSPAAVAPPPRVENLNTWIASVEDKAMAAGVAPTVAHDALDRFVPNPRVVQLDQKQPETTISFAQYRRNIVNDARVAKGADLMRRYSDILSGIELRTGVPPQIVVALWGIESNFGQNTGGFETINSLATLAYEGRRATFFEGELIAALQIVDRQHMDPRDLRGSWAGAMGQCQFMPTTYLRHAVDGDGDGRIDIWTDPVDTLASIANYLASEGWQQGQNWGRPVRAPGDLAGQTGFDDARPVVQWAQMGVTAQDGNALPQSGLQAALLQPDGADTQAFLAYGNLRAIMRWNHSTYFALSVGMLADAIREY